MGGAAGDPLRFSSCSIFYLEIALVFDDLSTFGINDVLAVSERVEEAHQILHGLSPLTFDYLPGQEIPSSTLEFKFIHAGLMKEDGVQ